MKEEAGVEPGLSANNSDASGVAPEWMAAAVVPPQQRVAMPVQRLEPASLRRLFGGEGGLVPARIPARIPSNER